MPLPETRTSEPDRDPSERERAFDMLFRQHYTALCRFAGRILGTDAQAEDVVQELFLYIWDRHEVIDEATPSRAYLYRATHNAALNRLRHEQVERRWAEGEGKPREEGGATAADELEYGELAMAVRQAIERLPERCRLVYTLSRQERLSYPEIAATLGISVKTVESQMTRAFRQLRAAIGPFLAGITLLLR